jgi:hypothetical protein
MEVFGDTFVPPGLQEVWARSQRCPRCVWPYLGPVVSVDQTRWLCPSCGHCWYIEHGRLRPVDPITCRGCAACARNDCIRLLQRDFPRFGAGAACEDELVPA